MREWKFLENGVVHDVEPWPGRCHGKRCDIEDGLEKITWTDAATTCFACLALRGVEIPKTIIVRATEPRYPTYLEPSYVYKPADRSSGVAWEKMPT
jgi:hypothetical protein